MRLSPPLYFNVKAYGAVGNGVADDTVAIQSAITAAGDGNIIWFPPGNYYITGRLNVSGRGAHVLGAGKGATRIKFVPINSNTCFHFESNPVGSVLYYTSIKGFEFYSTDQSHQKTAIKLVDVSICEVSDIVSTQDSWIGSKSVIVETHGRDSVHIHDVSLYADRPIYFAENPNFNIDVDVFKVSDAYQLVGLSDLDDACIYVDPGLWINNLTIENVDFISGKHGFYWNDTAPFGAGHNISFRNMRCEQTASAGGHIIHINAGGNIYGLTIENCEVEPENAGIYLRGIIGGALKNVTFDAATPGDTTLDVQNCVDLSLDNIFTQPGTIASLTGMTEVNSIPCITSNGALPASGYYVDAAITNLYSTTKHYGVNTKSWTQVINNDGILRPDPLWISGNDFAAIYEVVVYKVGGPFESAIFAAHRSESTLLSGTSNMIADVATAGKFSFDGLTFTNKLGAPVTAVISVKFTYVS